jgi:hypothetical protein
VHVKPQGTDLPPLRLLVKLLDALLEGSGSTFEYITSHHFYSKAISSTSNLVCTDVELIVLEENDLIVNFYAKPRAGQL